MKKQVLSIFLVLCIVFALLPFAALADNSGSCGEHAVWKLEGDTLTISGTGPIQDYAREQHISYSGNSMQISYSADTPWFETREQIKHVVISDGITRIGDSAFYDVPMDSISIPDSVTEIGDYALSTGLVSEATLSVLDLPQHLKTIGRHAFGGRGFRVLRFPSTVNEIGDFAISGHPNLEVLSFAEGFETIPQLMIAATYSIIAIDVPASTKRIEFLPERLTDIYYHGTEAQWKSVEIQEGIEYRAERADVHFGDSLAQFSDAPAKDEWSYESIRFCTANGYMNGMGEGLFQPNGLTTRAQLVTILWRMNGSPAAETSADFTDTKEHWAKSAIDWAAENDIVNGMGEGLFAPDQSITREQLVTIFYRYCKEYLELEVGIDDQSPLDTFSDADQVSDWALDAMKWAVLTRLISGVGTPDGPQLQSPGHATRAQIARIIMSFYVNYAYLKYEKTGN